MTNSFDDLETEIVTSRRALVNVIIGLADQREALTVLGGHAVIEVTHGPTVDTYVAGPAALLCAKAYKIHDRLEPTELRRNADRLRPKDFADLYRLLIAVAPADVAVIFARGIADTRIGEAVSLGRDHLVEILADSSTVASMVADAWGNPSREAEFQAQVDGWRRVFTV